MPGLDAIVLAGGLGTRLRSAVPHLPKALAPVGGRPFLDFLLAQLGSFHRLHRVILATGYKGEMIEARYRDQRTYGFQIGFSVESCPMGTGGALLRALPLTDSPQVLLLNGDSYVEFSLDALLEAHSKSGAAVTMVVTEVESVARYGAVLLDDTGCKVTGFAEKSGGARSGLINAGCYLLDRKAFEGFEVQPQSLEKDLLPRLINGTFAVRGSKRFIDIGTPETYHIADEFFARTLA